MKSRFNGKRRLTTTPEDSQVLAKPTKLAHDLDRQVNNLAEIIIEFYREWKQQ